MFTILEKAPGIEAWGLSFQGDLPPSSFTLTVSPLSTPEPRCKTQECSWPPSCPRSSQCGHSGERTIRIISPQCRR